MIQLYRYAIGLAMNVWPVVTNWRTDKSTTWAAIKLAYNPRTILGEGRGGGKGRKGLGPEYRPTIDTYMLAAILDRESILHRWSRFRCRYRLRIRYIAWKMLDQTQEEEGGGEKEQEVVMSDFFFLCTC